MDCGLAFISANLGAQEVIGMGASGAKYGIATSHFYWVGAGISEAAVRRKNARVQCLHLRDHDGLLLGHIHVCHGALAAIAIGMEFSFQRADVGAHRAGVHVLGRAYLGPPC